MPFSSNSVCKRAQPFYFVFDLKFATGTGLQSVSMPFDIILQSSIKGIHRHGKRARAR
jgi:hypothetical protein